ncbi:lysophospholipid acyltransferase family protein [Nocardioides marmotae]|uniref:1-acyl-sn-glycerol-3-phosphate acyltransferase n=1 Tax=Nocardioides marmotae TaxID=2663857 RepID=A0A6I3JHB2_9ACTN|nr:lysophospholipid acyltransferase family protein [Nocardioides marmotae]MCR6033812.1 1-acyl-sn-glycerol-3-phosphate acyltransferase [Gordonia jinghuaiqii]MBC9735449.1 1-acyl-sn-glycerol-3-phosphate acyltransferase [Nocardioides marmotae]MTB86546.1 1-acyl-sn-glycerol-3-phosphate acyltransferase [Nocardioides marmotae]MTB97470.1 1-acyl-sn-glycerol-3-phosphate acyltransferase [Nocardioides marmotae]QKE01655.1 1-acyl-sn-glycerol-3-phosphate acyltransferase [Nocardioides marmotae]
MTRPASAAHLERPRSDGVPHPARSLLHSARPAARWLVRRRNHVEVHGAAEVPARGPVIFAANHIGVADGPLLAAFAPRPVHALTKVEMFEGRMGRFLTASGQIPVDRFHPDPRAVRTCLRVLRDGGAVGVFPEGRRGAGELDRFHRGAAYLALVSGAPVVPTTFFGTRAPGAHMGELPPRGGRVAVCFGTPWQVPATPFPRTREQVGQASLFLREHMLVQQDRARRSTGLELPGPLPATDVEPDPATGVTEQGAP